MNMEQWITTLGYVASVLVALSLTMTSILRLRIINFFGCIAFVGYALAIGATPVALTNGIIALINVVQLIRLVRDKEYITALRIEKDFAYLSHFLAIHREDIATHFPDFDPHSLPFLTGFYVLRNDATAGVFLGRKNENDDFVIVLDYVVPRYRDLKVGRWVFKMQERFFRDLGCKRFVSESRSKAHVRYLAKMGFVADAEAPHRYVRTIW